MRHHSSLFSSARLPSLTLLRSDRSCFSTLSCESSHMLLRASNLGAEACVCERARRVASLLDARVSGARTAGKCSSHRPQTERKNVKVDESIDNRCGVRGGAAAAAADMPSDMGDAALRRVAGVERKSLFRCVTTISCNNIFPRSTSCGDHLEINLDEGGEGAQDPHCSSQSAVTTRPRIQFTLTDNMSVRPGRRWSAEWRAGVFCRRAVCSEITRPLSDLPSPRRRR